MKQLACLLTLACLIGGNSLARAGEMIPQSSPKAPLPAADVMPVEDDWNVDLWADAWLTQASISLTNSTLGISPSVFLGFDTILKNLDWIVPVGADVRYKQFGLAADLFAAKISGATVTPHETLFTTADIEMTLAIVNLLGYVRLVEDERFSFDLMGGARYLYVKQTLDLSGGLVGGRVGTVRSVVNPKIWDGVVGARLDCALTDQLSILTYGDVGTGNSDLTWQVWANLVYHFTDNFSLAGGYRYLTWDGGGDDTDVRLTLSGPVVTFLFHF